MNRDIKDINLNLDVLKSFYKENKNFLTPLSAIFIGIVLVIFFVIPQINGFFQKQSQIESEQAKLTHLKQSLAVLSSASEPVLDRDISIASQALPATKDFASVMNSISNAAASSQVSLGDFEFQIGDITKTAEFGSATPSLKISLNITGDVDSIVNFVGTIYKSVPIAQVETVKSSGNFSTLQVSFYFKPFPPQNSNNPENIKSVTQKEQEIIDAIVIPDSLSSDLLNSLQSPDASASSL